MNGVAQQVAAGLSAGGIYGLLALGIVLVRRASGVINFAQAALATLAAFVAAALIAHGWRFWPAFGVTIGLSFVVGVALERTLVRPARRGPAPGATLLTLGLLLAVNGLDTWIWGSVPRPFDRPFSARLVHVAGLAVSRRDLATAGVALTTAGLVLLLMRRTKLGLGLRATAIDADRARRLGLNVSWIATFAWGVATVAGAVAGVLAAPAHGVDPSMLRVGLLYALAAAVIGGIDSLGGAVVGGLVVGVGVQLLGAYVHWVGPGLRPASVFAALLLVLLVRPSGVFARRAAGLA